MENMSPRVLLIETENDSAALDNILAVLQNVKCRINYDLATGLSGYSEVQWKYLPYKNVFIYVQVNITRQSLKIEKKKNSIHEYSEIPLLSSRGKKMEC